MEKTNNILKNDLGDFTVKYFSGDRYLLANIASKTLGTIILMLPYNDTGISDYQMNCFRKIEKDWEVLLGLIGKKLSENYKIKKLKLDSITINEEIRPDSYFDAAFVFKYRKNFFSTQVISVTFLIKEWEVFEVSYL